MWVEQLPPGLARDHRRRCVDAFRRALFGTGSTPQALNADLMVTFPPCFGGPQAKSYVHIPTMSRKLSRLPYLSNPHHALQALKANLAKLLALDNDIIRCGAE
eukprot:624208-Pelagomonas_calceolata.AAC.1